MTAEELLELESERAGMSPADLVVVLDSERHGGDR